MFEYQAKIVRVLDGDTIAVKIDLGFGVWIDQTVRLARINAQELHGKSAVAALIAKTALSDYLMNKPGPMVLRTYKGGRDTFNRYLADVLMGPEQICVNDWMVSNLYAEPYAK